MVGRLKKHITRQRIDDDDPDDLEFNEEDEIPTDESISDPRWDGLQNIFENN
jgi:hypothetical protein